MERVEQYREGWGATALWWGMLAGPIGVALDEGLSYAIVQHSCSTGYHWLLHFYTLVGIAFALSGYFVAHRAYRDLPNARIEDAGVPNRSRWMAIYGMASSIAFVVVNIAMAIPKWTMNPCDQ